MRIPDYYHQKPFLSRASMVPESSHFGLAIDPPSSDPAPAVPAHTAPASRPMTWAEFMAGLRRIGTAINHGIEQLRQNYPLLYEILFGRR